MKTIKEYLKLNKDYDKNDILNSEWNMIFQEHIEDFYGKNNIPNDYQILIENSAIRHIGYDYINENLKTHNTEKLKKKLIEYYGNDIENFNDYEGNEFIKSFWIILKNNSSKLNLKNINDYSDDIKDFDRLLNFFNYHYGGYKLNDDKKYQIFIEPIYSEEYKELNKYHNKAYHFTHKNNIQNILNNGIRLRGKIGLQRTYPQRIYLYAEYKKLKETKELKDFLNQLFRKETSLKDVGIIQVDFNKLNWRNQFPIYKDTAMKQKQAIFVYNSIPANLCKEIKYE